MIVSNECINVVMIRSQEIKRKVFNSETYDFVRCCQFVLLNSKKSVGNLSTQVNYSKYPQKYYKSREEAKTIFEDYN